MVDYCPTAYTVLWQDVLNKALAYFFVLFNNDFTEENGIFVYSGGLAKKTLKTVFEELIEKVLVSVLAKISQEKHRTKKIYVIDTCLFNNNLANIFSKKQIEKIDYSYALADSAVSLDWTAFELMFRTIFKNYFTGKKIVHNVKFVKHKNFSAKILCKLIRKHYGNSHYVKCGEKFFGSQQTVLKDLNNDVKLSKKLLMDEKNKKLFECKVKEFKQFMDFD